MTNKKEIGTYTAEFVDSCIDYKKMYQEAESQTIKDILDIIDNIRDVSSTNCKMIEIRKMTYSHTLKGRVS